MKKLILIFFLFLFSVSSYSLELKSFIGREAYMKIPGAKILWESDNNVSTIDIYYYNQPTTSWKSIATNVTANLGTYTWQGSDKVNSEGIRIKIEDASNGEILAMSKAYIEFVNIMFKQGYDQFSEERTSKILNGNVLGDYLYINPIDNITEGFNFEIHNLEGLNFTESTERPSAFQLDISKLNSGTYFLKVTDEYNQTYFAKFIKF